MTASNFLELEVLDHIFGAGNRNYVAPTNVFIALCTSGPVDTETSATITEANYTSYTRVSTDDTDWNTAAGGQLQT